MQFLKNRKRLVWDPLKKYFIIKVIRKKDIKKQFRIT